MTGRTEDPHGRADGLEKVTGRAVYTGDLSLPGMLHAKVLRSPVPHARVRRIDVAAAESLRGVVAVLSRDNLQVASPYLGAQIKDQPIIALERVRYVGDIVAAVAATDEAAAEEALGRIEIDYEELPAVFTVEEALRPGAPLVHDRIEMEAREYGRGAVNLVHERTNICHHFRYSHGDVEQGFKEADHVFEDTFSLPAAHHSALEPHVSIARAEGETLTVWSATQTPFSLREELCRILGLSYNRVRVVVPYVGGSFGGRKSRTTAALAAILSRLARRPVRLAFTAEEGFRTITQGRMTVAIRTGVKRDGTFVARRCNVRLNAGAYSSNSPSLVEKAGYRAHGPYRIPHVLTDSYGVYTNSVPAGSFRGFGAPAVAFAYESHLDMIAHRLAMDPVELRFRNLLDQGEAYAPGDRPLDCDLKGALRQVVAVVDDWRRTDEPPPNGTARRGRAVACCIKDGGGTDKSAHAMVKVLDDGSILLFSGSVEIGQGARTALSRITAREFTVAPESVQVVQVDTHTTPFDTGTNSSSSTSIMGQAVQRAARDAVAQLRATAAAVLGAPVSAVELRDGRIVSNGRSMTFREVLQLRGGDAPAAIVGNGSFRTGRDRNAPLGAPSPFWEMGLGAAEVEVDVLTGEVRLLKYFSLTDAGTMIDPQRCRGQDEGSVLFGIGQALSEELIYANGRLLNGNPVDYRLPRFHDLPPVFSTRITESGGGPGPYGAKGIGEAAVLPVAAAICNAVCEATGTHMSEVPLTWERVWRALAPRD